MKRFFLAEPSLTGLSGHSWAYLRSLVIPVSEAGYEPVLLGNRNVDRDLAQRERIVPLFERWCDDRVGDHLATLAAHRRSIHADLMRVSSAFRTTADDVFLINTLRHWSLSGVVDWLESLPGRRRPRVALVLHFTSQPDPNGAAEMRPFYEEAFLRIERSSARRQFMLLADSEELIDEYRDVNPRLEYLLAPIPHMPPDICVHDGSGAIQFGTVGEARENKGFHLLPHVVRRVATAGLDAHFHLHSFCQNRESIFYRQAIAGLLGPNVTLYDKSFDDEEYLEFIRGLDVVLLPYTLVNYHRQTSGVLAEAMAMGKSTIVPRGTWMARQVEAFGGGALFNPGDAEDLTREVIKFIERGSRDAEGAATRAERWRKIHNPANLLSLLLRAAGNAARAA